MTVVVHNKDELEAAMKRHEPRIEVEKPVLEEFGTAFVFAVMYGYEVNIEQYGAKAILTYAANGNNS